MSIGKNLISEGFEEKDARGDTKLYAKGNSFVLVMNEENLNIPINAIESKDYSSIFKVIREVDPEKITTSDWIRDEVTKIDLFLKTDANMAMRLVAALNHLGVGISNYSTEDSFWIACHWQDDAFEVYLLDDKISFVCDDPSYSLINMVLTKLKMFDIIFETTGAIDPSGKSVH